MTRTLLALFVAAFFAGCSSPSSPISGAGSGGLVIIPHAINFGSDPSGQPKDTTVELFDEAIDSVTITASGASPSVTDTNFTHVVSLAPDGSHTIAIRFTPSSQTTNGTDTLRYIESGKNYTALLTLDATDTGGGTTGGTSGSLFVPAEVDFGSVAVGVWRDTTVALVNTGNQPVTILSSAVNSVQAQDTNFRLPVTIQGGGYILIHLQFNPNAPGPQSAIDSIHYAAGGTQHYAVSTLTATGVSASNTPSSGSTFTYDYSAVDTTGVTGPHSDSTYTVVTNTLSFGGKANVVEVQGGNGSISYFHLESNGDISIYADLSSIPIPIGITLSWFTIPIGSKTPQSNSLFDSTITMPYGGTTVPVAVSLTSTAKDLGPATITAAGHSFPCEQGSITVTLTATAFGGLVPVASSAQTTTVWYSKQLKYYPERQDEIVNSGILQGNTTSSDTYLLKSYSEK